MIVGTAQAATTGVASGSFWHSPTFWVAVSFVILIALLCRPVWRFTTKALDDKIAEIRSRVEEATQLREEAQNLLAATKRKLTEAEKEGEDIIAAAREEAQVLRQRMTDDLETGLKRREKQAIDRIAQAESDATAEVRAIAADIAIDATRTLLASEIRGDKAASLIDDAIKDLPDKLN
ncbi:MAG: F0F1 ATP synthase subunit B [Pseudomonadota bacterium]|nr:F0F1 ATP synthase subunit B [Pseudomonadota bacterium]